MAKEHSFDISAQIDTQELKNALDQARREVSNRYDFKGLTAEYDYNEKDKTITITASSDSKADAMIDILLSKMIKRGLSPKALKEKSREDASKGNKRVIMQIRDTLSTDEAKKIVKDIKALKLKVQASIRGDVVRVSGKSIDDLQAVIKAIREKDYDLPLNFINMK
ncbi:MAG: YajQ family cyclic di-GMP-binding protein [Epsilonproteobacteria bacterium]|nr:YajQ family cyclic di-GMP-binding protein [Campylobacterota bacterium]